MAEPAEARETPETPPVAPSTHPLASLEHRNFRLYWGGTLVSNAGSQMQQAAVAWQIYVLTHSALALGFMGLFRVLPIVAFSLWGGVVADAVDRRRLLIVAQSVLLLLPVALAIVTLTGIVQLWMIYLLTSLAAGAMAFANPAQQALVPSLVPREQLTNALSLSTTAWQVAMVFGPSLAGFIIAAWGVGTVYLINAVTYLAILAALIRIHPPPITGKLSQISVKSALEGLHFVRRTPIILSTMSLDFVATFFGSATALLPIFARDILHVGSQGYGILYAGPSVGAVTAGVIMSFLSPTIRSKGSVILGAVGAYAICTILFGISRTFALSLLALAGVGAADTVSMILRQTVRQLVTPDSLRGRMTSVNMVFFMGGPQLGEVEAGLVARSFGAPLSVISGGVAALLATGLIAWYSTGLRHYRD